MGFRLVVDLVNKVGFVGVHFVSAGILFGKVEHLSNEGKSQGVSPTEIALVEAGIGKPALPCPIAQMVDK